MRADFSIWSGFYFELPTPEDAILAFIEDGIYATELAHEHAQVLLKREGTPREIGLAFRAFLDDRGFSIPQGHLSYTIPICGGEENTAELLRQIELFSGIGITEAVLHCDALADSELSLDEKLERNVEALRPLAEAAEKYGICLCLENLRGHTPYTSADILIRIIEMLGSPAVGICLDTGHLNLSRASSQREFILCAGKYLRALHIADNDGSGDQHLMPFGVGKVNFSEVVTALREINYEGLFNYEIPGERSRCPLALRHAKAALAKAGYEYLMAQR